LGVLEKLRLIWISNLPDKFKRDFFRELFVLIYSASLAQRLLKCLDDTYTGMLRTVMNISWREHPTIRLAWIINLTG